jgi:putative membrane protein insertion efficiency factor
MKALLITTLAGYKRWISPLLPHSCRFVPTCSEYTMEAVERHGALLGLGMGLWRLLRCNPLCAAGHDPVPAQTIRLRSQNVR